MADWKDTVRKLCDENNREVLIACHRGKFSSSVMENTTLAFLVAVGEGADMVEMDLARTKDGRIVAHHDNTLERLFHDPSRVCDHTLDELLAMPLYNYVGEICVERLETFDEILDGLKNRTVLVLDKCWDCWDEVYELLKSRDMTDQAVFKFYLKDDGPLAWAAAHGDCRYIPMCGDPALFGRMEELRKKACVPAVEILPHSPQDAVFSEDSFAWLAEHRYRVWCNSLSLARRLVYGAGYDDLKSLYEGGDRGWGVLVERGVDIIQTDWPLELARYLNRGA